MTASPQTFPPGARRMLLLFCLWHGTGLRAADGADHAPGTGPGDAFQATVDSIMPLGPQEIRRLRSIIEDKQAAAHRIQAPARTSLKTMSVSLQSGASTPQVMLLPGHAVGFEILDSTSSPWPIASYTVGDPQRFHVVVPEIGLRNILTITPQTRFGRSNLVVQLAQQSTPVSFTLQADTRITEFHDRVRVLIAGRGPQASEAIFQPEVSTEDASLLAALDGLAPEGAEPLHPSRALIENAWRRQDTLWLRGRFVLLSPAAWAQIAGSGEMMAYRLPYTPAVLIYDRAGNTHNVQLHEARHLAREPGLAN